MKTKGMKNKRMTSRVPKPAKRGIQVKGKWKAIELDPSLFSEEGLEGLVCFEELTSYSLIHPEKAAAQAAAKAAADLNKDKKKAKKRKVSKVEEGGEKTEEESQQPENTPEPAKKKAKKKKKNKKLSANESVEADNTSAEVTQKDADETVGDEETAKDEPSEPAEDETSEPAAELPSKPSKKKNTKRKKKQKQKTEKDTEDQSASQTPSDLQVLEKETPSEDKVSKQPNKRAKNWTNAAHSASDVKNSDVSAWKGLFVPSAVLKALSSLGFSSPTPIQALTLPPAIRDRMDILGAAETGKTLHSSFVELLFTHPRIPPWF